MSTTESLRVQLDALRVEKQQLQVENARLHESSVHSKECSGTRRQSVQAFVRKTTVSLWKHVSWRENNGLVAERRGRWKLC